MQWDHIISSILWFYFQACGVVLAYFAAKLYTARKRSRLSPPWRERLLRTSAAVVVLVIFSALFAAFTPSGNSHSATPINVAGGVTVLLLLVVPVLVGTHEGFCTTDEAFLKSYPSEGGDF